MVGEGVVPSATRAAIPRGRSSPLKEGWGWGEVEQSQGGSGSRDKLSRIMWPIMPYVIHAQIANMAICKYAWTFLLGRSV